MGPARAGHAAARRPARRRRLALPLRARGRHATPRAPPPAPGECAEPAFATERAALEWLCAWVVERVHCDEWEAFLEARAPSDLVREVAEEYGIYLAPPTAAVGGSETDWSSGDP